MAWKKKALVSSAIAVSSSLHLWDGHSLKWYSSLTFPCVSEKLHDQVWMPVASIAPFVDVAFLYFPVQNLLGIHFCDLAA